MVASYCTVAGEGVPDFVVAVQILGPRSEIAVAGKRLSQKVADATRKAASEPAHVGRAVRPERKYDWHV